MTNLANLPIPLEVLYAGLAGTVLALIVATDPEQLVVPRLLPARPAARDRLALPVRGAAQGQHAPRRPDRDEPAAFTSEPYFRALRGRSAPFMRKQFGDPAAIIEAQVKPPKETDPEEFDRLSLEEQAAACPAAVATATRRRCRIEGQTEDGQKMPRRTKAICHRPTRPEAKAAQGSRDGRGEGSKATREGRSGETGRRSPRRREGAVARSRRTESLTREGQVCPMGLWRGPATREDQVRHRSKRTCRRPGHAHRPGPAGTHRLAPRAE